MKWLMAMIVGLIAAAEAGADVGPLPGMKTVYAVHCIETEQEFPEFVFLLVRFNWRDRAVYPEFVTLTPDKPLNIRLDGPVPGVDTQNREDATLRVIKRSDIKPGMSPHEVLKLETQFLNWFDYRTMVPSWSGDKQRTLIYRVQRSESEVGLEIVQVGRDPSTQWLIAFRCVAVAVTMAVLLGGIWFIRRMRRAGRVAK
ncbi:MAG: hypothetical protein C0467_21365 [Planctomycetaceae bacterium]|nr:hypothetical protein [Planctomycetaceae bacterium]